MNIIAKHTNFSVAALGDIHGKFYKILDIIENLNIEDCIIFQVGDFGVGFYNGENFMLSMLNDNFYKRNVFLYAIRGNHDDPSLFNGTNNYSNIIFMQDYDVVEVDGRRYVGIGGATSVDKVFNGRIQDVDWWPDEVVVYDQNKIDGLKDIDVIFAHTCPDFANAQNAFNNNFIKKCLLAESDLKERLVEERRLMSKIFHEIKKNNQVSKFIYGHFHYNNKEEFYSTEFVLLGCDEIMEVRL